MSTSGDFETDLNSSVSCNSFWDVKQYVRCVRRLENGNKLCSDICNMIQDRVEIEKNYSASLHKWSSKWASYLENGGEYGTVRACWMGWCTEAESLSDLHKEIRTKLIDEVQNDVRNWQKEHHHKSALPPQHLKEAKSLEADFDNAQKPWAKKMKKMSQCKKDYQQQCKMVKSCETQNKNAVNDNGISPEQLKKMEEKLKKAEKDSDKLKSCYEASLQELSGDCARYTEEMTKVFDKSQAMERERMTFFKSIFIRIQKILNLSENKSIPDIYSNFEKIIDNLDPEFDLKQWSQSYGSDMQFVCPQFEDFTSEQHNSSKKKINATNDTSGTLAATNYSSRQASIRSGDTSSRSAVNPSTGTESSTPSPNMDVAIPVYETRSESFVDEQTPPSKPRRFSSINKSPFCEDAQTPNKLNKEDKESPVFSDEIGTQVKALYDYNGVEEDELTLKQGEIFLKLEDEDEQGWCKGKKDGRVGLYPANYAEIV